MSRFLAVVVLCAAAVQAQIPYGHLIYVHRTPSSTVPAIGIVDPDFGTPTPLLPQTGALTTHGSRSVAIDPSAPSVLYSLTTLSTSISMVAPVLTLTGNRFTRTNLPVNLGVPGVPFSLRWASGHGLLLLGRGGQINRMFLRNMTTGVVTSQPTATLLPNNATDMGSRGALPTPPRRETARRQLSARSSNGIWSRTPIASSAPTTRRSVPSRCSRASCSRATSTATCTSSIPRPV
jgi:hypothetical protein